MTDTCERVITIPEFAPTDVAVIDPSNTLGVLIVGQAQAGKTTLKDIVCETWGAFDPEGFAMPFANSNGFRGITFLALKYGGIQTDEAVDDIKFQSILESYLEATEVESTLERLYADPLDESLLRNPAVDSVVAISAEHPLVRPATNDAGAQLLRVMLNNPGDFGMSEKPGLVVLDTRNCEEGEHKLSEAGVQLMGTLVLTCPEEVIASRKSGVSADSIRRRNAADRNRNIGRMTLPEDFGTTYVVDEMIADDNVTQRLLDAGFAVASSQDAAIVLRTDRLTIREEQDAIDPIMNGMLAACSI